MSECKIISTSSRKGGVGKSTVCKKLGYYLAEQGYHTLLVDTDSQGNLSTGFGEPKTANQAETIVEPMWAVMQDEQLPPIESFIKRSGKLSYIPCNESLAALELQMVGIIQREFILKNVLDAIKSEFNYILLDTGPSLGLMTVNALVASDSVLIVSSPEEDSNTGAELLIKSIQQVRRNLNKTLTVEGILMIEVAGLHNRNFALIHFASSLNFQTDLFLEKKYTPTDVMQSASCFLGGGTNFETPMNEAIRLIESGNFNKADIVFITDGECSMSEDFTAQLKEKQLAHGFTVTGILMDQDDVGMEFSLTPFCNEVFRISDIGGDRIVDALLGERVV